MEIGTGTANRRPLKSRGTRWAAAAARVAIRAGLTANQISFLGIVIAAIGAWALLASQSNWWLYVVAASCIQLRLLANMLDGMVAVEGGRGEVTGPIWNEFPDRLEDSLFLVAAGYAAGFGWLGWLAALLAAVCAYVRLLGGSLGFPQDFVGPAAKPHRMAALTIACLATLGTPIFMPLALATIAAFTLITIFRRLTRLAGQLRETR
jgi:phosphatidylglycerophosphate synthase